MADNDAKLNMLEGELTGLRSIVNALKARGTDTGGNDGPPVVGIFSAPGSALNLTNIDFGYSITNATSRIVAFNPGVFRFSQQHFTVAGAAGVVINMSPAYIYLEYFRGAAPLLMSPTGDINATIPDTSTYRHLFYTFTISETAGLEISKIHHLGSVFVGAYWA